MKQRLNPGPLVVLSSLAFLASCGGSDSSVLAAQHVSAAQGGTVTTRDGAVTLTIPPGALSMDTYVAIKQVADLPPTGSPLVADGIAYAVAFNNGATLSKPMTVDLIATTAPLHPQLGEIAVSTAGDWSRLPSNFFRHSDNHVISLTTSTAGDER